MPNTDHGGSGPVQRHAVDIFPCILWLLLITLLNFDSFGELD